MRKNITLIASLALLLIFNGEVNSQQLLPGILKISSGRCNSGCGYSKGFDDLYYKRELVFNLADSTFKFRRKSNKSYIKIDKHPPNIFLDSTTYTFLDSLYNEFTAFKSSRGKYFIYRIELIYCNSKIGLPIKSKSMSFFITTNPNRIHPKLIDDLIIEYNKLIHDFVPWWDH